MKGNEIYQIIFVASFRDIVSMMVLLKIPRETGLVRLTVFRTQSQANGILPSLQVFSSFSSMLGSWLRGEMETRGRRIDTIPRIEAARNRLATAMVLL